MMRICIPLFFGRSCVWVVLMCAGVSLVLLSVDASAEESSPQLSCEDAGTAKQERPKHRRAKIRVDFKSLDTDGDGFLSFDEFSQSARLSRMDVKKRRKLFDYLDQNNQGRLHLRDLHFPPPRCISVLRKAFDRLDVDQSKTLNFSEFSKATTLEKMDKKAQKCLFKRLDKNRDQLIQRSELKTKGFRRGHHPNHFKKYDVNSSGGLDFDEFLKLPWVGRIPENRKKVLFGELDLDNDGEVSSKEVRAAWAGRRKSCPPQRVPPIRKKK